MTARLVNIKAISGQRLGKHVPVARQLQQLDYKNGSGVFSIRSVPRCYEDSVKQRVQLRDGGQPAVEWVREAEECPMLEAVGRERQVKIQQAERGLAGSVMVCELWRLAVAL
jgi:hypothetical protein